MGTKHISAVGYVGAYLGLLLLAGASLVFSLFIHWTAGNIVFSLLFAAGKAMLVLWIFMHLAEQRFSNRFVVAVAFAMLFILMSLTVIDVATRQSNQRAPRPTTIEQQFYRR